MIPLQIAPHLFQIPLGFVNAYAICTLDKEWVLVDTGLKIHAAILENVANFFGGPPRAIVLTHGHFDHAGSAQILAQKWGVKVYCGAMEKPFLSGKNVYPPADATVGGALAFWARWTSWPKLNLSNVLETVPADAVEWLSGWKVISTPGHTPGHISLWHETEALLVAGDALCTVDADSLWKAALQRPELARPGAPFTPDWKAARQSVGLLANLNPVVVAAGHGPPLKSGDVARKLREFARDFQMPRTGRYAVTPAKLDENGQWILPPEPDDDWRKNAGFLVAAGVVAVGTFFLRQRARRKTS